jgi:hypothetical protein
VLEFTQSAVYTASSPPLPQSIYQEGQHLMEGFARTMRLNACQAKMMQTKKDVKEVDGDDPAHISFGGFMWAFKKPDLMNLLPFMLKSFPDMQVTVLT